MEAGPDDCPERGRHPFPSDYCLLVRSFSSMGFSSSSPANLVHVLHASRSVLAGGSRRVAVMLIKFHASLLHTCRRGGRCERDVFRRSRPGHMSQRTRCISAPSVTSRTCAFLPMVAREVRTCAAPPQPT